MTQLSLFDHLSPSPVAASTNVDLIALAHKIRAGREQLAARDRRENRISRIGDLARSVLVRHDLVARRRAERQNQADRLTAGIAATAARLAGDDRFAGDDRLAGQAAHIQVAS